MNKMKNFIIKDSRGEEIMSVSAGNGKTALKHFRQSCTSTGIYEIRKLEGVWTLSTSFGAYYTAQEVRP